MKVLYYAVCVEAISVMQMEGKIISIDRNTPQSIKDIWMLHNDKEN